jgi:hypothetical protein
VNADDFPTEWGTFESTARLILSLPDGCLAATFNISAAYRLTLVRPSQQNTLCIFWNDKVYVDRAVMFGLTSSAGVFGSIADMLVAIYGGAGFKAIKKWVDDFFVIRFPHESWTEQEFMELTGAIGVPWSLKKMRPLTATQHYIGFLWNLDARTAALPEEKVWAAQALLRKWLNKGSVFSAHDAASVHGKLVHISCIYKLIRPFLCSIAHFAQSFSSGRAKLTPPMAVTADMSWVDFIISISPNEISLAHPEPIDIGWWGDASSSFGIGIVIGSRWAVWKWATGIRVSPKSTYDISWAKAVAVELGLCLAAGAGLLNTLRGQPVLVRSDNMGVVVIMNKAEHATMKPTRF